MVLLHLVLVHRDDGFGPGFVLRADVEVEDEPAASWVGHLLRKPVSAELNICVKKQCNITKCSVAKIIVYLRHTDTDIGL
jgi:hypothetical protein